MVWQQQQQQQQQQTVGSGHAQEWTLILWDIENVAVPEELRNANGVQVLTKLLKDKFAIERYKELYSIKLACHWSHPKAPYSDLLGSLTTLGDVEALSYQWQGYGGDKIHNADRMLRRASDRFMRLMERKGPDAPKHLVVFITSDEDFSEKIAELQARNFTVEVLYHNPSASKKPVSIINAANRSYDWLPFLTLHLQQFKTLTLRYDPGLYHPVTRSNRAHTAGSPCQPPPAGAQPRQLAYKQGATQKSAATAASQHQAQAGAASGQIRGFQGQPNGPARQPKGSFRRPTAPVSQFNRPALQATSAPSAASGAALVAIYGLEESQLCVSTKCSFLLARVLGQQVANSITVTIVPGMEGHVAMLNFGAMVNPVDQAKAAVCSLDGQFFDDEAIRAEFVGHAYTAPEKPSELVTSHTSSQATSVSAPSSRAAAWAKPLQSNAGSEGKAAASPLKLQETIEHGVPPRGSQPVPGKGDISPAQGAEKEPGYSINEPVSEAPISLPASSFCAVKGAVNGKPCSTAACVNSHDASPPDSAVCWGCENPRDGGTELFHNDMVNLEMQYQRLHRLDSADRPASEHRRYELLVGDDLCTVDLLTMLLSRENGGKAPCEHVWRCDV